MPQSPPRTLLGLDMGGTHTDAVLVHKGVLAASVKVITRHDDLLGSARQALQTLFAQCDLPPSCVERATFGTTLAVNAVVQKACDPVGLLYAAGPGLDPAWVVPEGIQAMRISGGLDHRGTEIMPLDTAQVKSTVTRWKKEGIRSFACVTKFSVRNPVHEEQMEECIRHVFQESPAAPVPTIALGHRLSGELNFPRRVVTACWNAALWRLHNHFAAAMEASLQELGITAPACLLKADGGAIPLAASRTMPVEALLSGPAASVMGILATRPEPEDLLALDMGGTTTDIALLAHGQPLLAPDALVINGRSTLVRALHSLSIGLGGDSLIRFENDRPTVGPFRVGPAVAFGGQEPTFLDALNVLGFAQAGESAASRMAVETLAAQRNLTGTQLAEQVVRAAQAKLAAAVQKVLAEINGRPVYTLAALLENRKVTPARAILVGGPARAVAPLLEEALHLPVTPLSNPQLSPVSNAAGAACTRPTASLDLFADTMTGNLLVPALGLKKTISRRYTLPEARDEACTLLSDSAENSNQSVDILEEAVFATLDERGHSGRDIRIRCQLRPGVDPLCEKQEEGMG